MMLHASKLRRRLTAALAFASAFILGGAVLSTPTVAADPPTAQSTITVTNADEAPFQVGDTIEFSVSFTNNTGKTRAIQSVASNMSTWDGCKWQRFAEGQTASCSFPTHVVTADDVKNGFTPQITWAMYPDAAYSGEKTNFAPTVGSAVSLAPVIVDLPTLELTAGGGKTTYHVGDTLTFSLNVHNPTHSPIAFDLATEQPNVAGTCASEALAGGENKTCTGLTYKVTSGDLERGSAEVKASVTATQGDNTLTVSKTATVTTPHGAWEQAQAFSPANVDPTLDGTLTLPVGNEDLTVLDTPVNGQYNIRIPAITVASNGDILASYDYRPVVAGGTNSGGDSPNPNSIVQKRSTDGGKTWGVRTVVAQGVVGDNPQGYSDPSYVVDYTTGKIFNFHVYSQVSGVFANSPAYTYGSDGLLDETNTHSMNLGLSVSSDNGHTWTQRVITAQALGDKAKTLQSCFASSGAGTQKQYGPQAGRLLQQAACVQKDGGVAAITLYSDDHGDTWKSGNLTPLDQDGTKNAWRFDENKVVELSDGTLMLNSRTGSGLANGYRLVAKSTDGGENWTELTSDEELVDATNNAQIIRAFPTAKEGTLRSKVLLFSNTPSGRSNGIVALSYDDGESWPIKTQVRAGGTGYTTIAIQPDGSIGYMLERDVYNAVSYMNLTLKDIAKGADLPFELNINANDAVAVEDGAAMSPLTLEVTGNDPMLADNPMTVTGLPQGLTFNAATKQITGTPDLDLTQAKDFTVTATMSEAEDGTGRPRQATKMITLTVVPAGVDPSASEWERHNVGTDDYAKLLEKLNSDEPITWLFTGDSITHGVQHTNGLKRFTEYFEDYLRTNSLLCKDRSKDVVLNTGVSSATTQWAMDYNDGFVADRHADVVFITFGMNDGRNNPPAVSLDTFKANLKSLVDQVRAEGGVPILMTQNYSRTKADDANLDNFFNAERQMAKDENLMMIDFNQWWKDNGDGGANTAWTNDTLHPNQLGHLLWAKLILQDLNLLEPDTRLAQTKEAVLPRTGAEVNTDVALTDEQMFGTSGLDLQGVRVNVNKTFDGNSVQTVSEGLDAFTKASEGNFTARFKVNQAEGAKEYVVAAFTNDANGKVVTISVQDGYVRISRDYQATANSYGYYSLQSATNVSDGNFHVVSVNVKNNQIAAYLDGQALRVINGNGVETAPSTLGVNTLTIGGPMAKYLSRYSIHAGNINNDVANAKVTVDYVEAYGQQLSPAQIASLNNGTVKALDPKLTELYSKAVPQMWAFLGGATTQGTLPEISAKNYVQAFEEVVRWEHGYNPKEQRMKFVENAGLNGLTSQQLLDRYDQVVHGQAPDVVMIAPDVVFKGQVVEKSAADFKANIQALVNKAKADQAVVVLITPPNLSDQAGEYAEAMRAIAEDQDLTLVDAYKWLAAVNAANDNRLNAEWFDNQGFMRAKGQVELAKFLMETIQMMPSNLAPSWSRIWALDYDGDATPATLQTPEFKMSESCNPDDLVEVTPAPVVFVDKDAVRTYTVPDVVGVEYLVDGKVVTAGTYQAKPGQTVTVSAQAGEGFVLAAGAATSWSHTFSEGATTQKAKAAYSGMMANTGAYLPVGAMVALLVAGVSAVTMSRRRQKH